MSSTPSARRPCASPTTTSRPSRASSRPVASPGGGPAATEAIVQVPSDVVALAVRVAELAALLAESGPDHLTGDAVTAAFLAAAAAESAAALVGANIADSDMTVGAELADPRLEHVEERAGHARALAERLV